MNRSAERNNTKRITHRLIHESLGASLKNQARGKRNLPMERRGVFREINKTVLAKKGDYRFNEEGSRKVKEAAWTSEEGIMSNRSSWEKRGYSIA